MIRMSMTAFMKVIKALSEESNHGGFEAGVRQERERTLVLIKELEEERGKVRKMAEEAKTFETRIFNAAGAAAVLERNNIKARLLEVVRRYDQKVYYEFAEEVMEACDGKK